MFSTKITFTVRFFLFGRKITQSREMTPGHMTPCGYNPEIVNFKIERKTDARRRISTMSLAKSVSALTFSLTLISNFFVVVSSDGLDPTISAPADKLEGFLALNAAAAPNLTVFRVATDSILTLNLLSSLPEDQEISVYCRQLLGIFRQRYAASIDCLVPAARPVKVCQNCFSSYRKLQDIYMNISSDQVCCGGKKSTFIFFV